MNQGELGLVDENNKFVGDQEHAKEAFYTAAAFSDYVFGMPDMYGTEWGAALNNGDVAAYCLSLIHIYTLRGCAPSSQKGQNALKNLSIAPTHFSSKSLVFTPH